jgi:acylglycerol lipase
MSAARPFDALATAAPDAREWGFEGARGVRLHAVSWRPQGRTRAAVVVVHGLKDHSTRYAGFAERLASRGIAMHAFDLRGHGRSEGERAWVDAFDDYLLDLETFVACVTNSERAAPLFLLGHSMGGAIATLWALERHAPFAGLLLSAPALRARLSFAWACAVRVVAGVAPRARVFQLDVGRFSRDRATVEDALRDGLVHHAPAPARTACELLSAMTRIEAGSALLDVPLLAMHGSADPITDPDGTVRLVDRAASRDKELRLYDGLAHDLLHEPERDRVMWDAIGWIEQRTD